MSFLFPKTPKPSPPPPVPNVKNTQSEGAGASAAQRSAAATGGFASTLRTGGLGVTNVSTSTAQLLGLTS